MSPPPLLSIIMPVFDSSLYLGAAIESMLNQTFSDFEIIVLDDCSQDDSFQIAQAYAQMDSRIRTYRNIRNMQLASTLNRAAKLSRGAYLARMDSDDLSLPRRLERQIALLENNPSIAIVGCNIVIIDASGKKVGLRRYYHQDTEIRKKIFFFSPFCHPAIMMRKSMLLACGGYNEQYIPAEDYELYFRIGKIGHFANINEYLFQYRINPNSISQTQTLNMEKQTIRVRKMFATGHGYTMPLSARIYNFLHESSLGILPPNFRKAIFFKWRTLVA